MLSAEKLATVVKSRKTCNCYQARENMQLLLSPGKHVTSAKRGKTRNWRQALHIFPYGPNLPSFDGIFLVLSSLFGEYCQHIVTCFISCWELSLYSVSLQTESADRDRWFNLSLEASNEVCENSLH